MKRVLWNIYYELVEIRKELQTIRESQELHARINISEKKVSSPNKPYSNNTAVSAVSNALTSENC